MVSVSPSSSGRPTATPVKITIPSSKDPPRWTTVTVTRAPSTDSSSNQSYSPVLLMLNGPNPEAAPPKPVPEIIDTLYDGALESVPSKGKDGRESEINDAHCSVATRTYSPDTSAISAMYTLTG